MKKVDAGMPRDMICAWERFPPFTPEQMPVSKAISTIETFGGYKFVRRYRHFNLDTNRAETCYVFTSVNGRGHQWEHDTSFTCIGQLRFYARQFEYTHGIR